MKPLESILQRIFYSQDRNDRDPNKPEDSAFFNAVSDIKIQSYAKWYKEQGGEYVVEGKEKEVIAYIQAIVLKLGHMKTLEDFMELMEVYRDLYATMRFIEIIETAFLKEEDERAS